MGRRTCRVIEKNETPALLSENEVLVLYVHERPETALRPTRSNGVESVLYRMRCLLVHNWVISCFLMPTH